MFDGGAKSFVGFPAVLNAELAENAEKSPVASSAFSASSALKQKRTPW
jgi:hypothetical protein